MSTVQIEKAKPEDLGAISRLGVDFGKEGGFDFNAEASVKLWESILGTGGLGEVLVARRSDDPERKPIGALGLLFAPDLNTGRLQAQEAFWFVNQSERGCGLRLLNAAEKRARERGATKLIMAHLCGLNDNLSRIYERRGYRPVETSYALDLWH